MDNLVFPSIRSYSLIKILQPTLEFESSYDKKGFILRGPRQGKRNMASFLQSRMIRKEQIRRIKALSVNSMQFWPTFFKILVIKTLGKEL